MAARAGRLALERCAAARSHRPAARVRALWRMGRACARRLRRRSRHICKWRCAQRRRRAAARASEAALEEDVTTSELRRACAAPNEAAAGRASRAAGIPTRRAGATRVAWCLRSAGRNRGARVEGQAAPALRGVCARAPRAHMDALRRMGACFACALEDQTRPDRAVQPSLVMKVSSGRRLSTWQ